MRASKFLFLTLCAAIFIPLKSIAQPNNFVDTTKTYTDTTQFQYSAGMNIADYTKRTKKRPWIAAAEVVGLNLAVNAFDRYVLKGDYAYINWGTIKHNFETGFVWDNDSFSTNLLSHPYHGSLYFTSARSNGMNFWASSAFALGGSLMWEFFMENEPPSINDVFSTAVGGSALGEIEYRISSLILDDSKTGFERVAREFFGGVIAPMRMFNRLVHGDVWQVNSSNTHAAERLPFNMQFATGWRYLAENNYFFRGYNGMYVELGITYGDPFYDDDLKPFDYFKVNATFNILGSQPLVSSVNAIGLIWGKSWEPLKGHDISVGIYQHFDYYDTDTLKHSCTVPFEISQSAAFGGGLMYKFPEIGNKINLSYNLYANIVLMGGTLTDYFAINDRNYNLGSGYNVKLQTELSFKNIADFYIEVDHYQLYTWKGYPGESTHTIVGEGMDIKYLNAQGNKGNTRLTIINPRLDVNINSKFKISVDPYLYFRYSHYNYWEDVNYRTFEMRLGLMYKI